jgi:hypothetical protein
LRSGSTPLSFFSSTAHCFAALHRLGEVGFAVEGDGRLLARSGPADEIQHVEHRTVELAFVKLAAFHGLHQQP